jgi:uncharacterized protein (DUF4213/DUF364 family)
MKKTPISILEDAKIELEEMLRENRIFDVQVSVKVKPLTPEEAIGSPQRRDFPIIEGKERVIEAAVLGARGHAFTDSPRNFSGTLGEVMQLPLTSNQNRAVFIAVMNAVLRHLGEVEGTVHCRDEDPEKCAKEIAAYVQGEWGTVRVGLIGLNPAIAEGLISTFGKDNVTVSDLNRDNIGQEKFGAVILDGRNETERLIEKSDVVVVTGTTLVNDTFDSIMNLIRTLDKDYIVYGVTGAGICHLMGLNRLCPYGRNQ